MELLDWESMNDLSTHKDGSLMKYIQQEGDLNVWDKPQPDDLVTVRARAAVASEKAPFLDETAEFVVKDGWLCPAVRLAVVTMKSGETVLLKVWCPLAVPSGCVLWLCPAVPSD